MTKEESIPYPSNHQVQDILDDMGMIDDKGCCPYTIEEIFRAGVEWLAKQGVSYETTVLENLDEASYEYMQHIPESEPELMDSFYTWEQMESAFKAGALWMAKQHADEISECTEKSFKSGAEYATNKAVEWLKDCAEHYYGVEGEYSSKVDLIFCKEELLEDFKKYMEE